MNPDESTTFLDITLEGSAFGGFGDRRSGGREEDDGAVAREPGRREPAGIGGRVHPKAVVAAERADGCGALVDRSVTVPGGFREDENAVGMNGSSGGLAARRDEQQPDGQNQRESHVLSIRRKISFV